jgi:muconolactone delta-isomerase
LPDTAPAAAGQLFDLKRDPGETTNLALKHSDVVDELEALLKQSLASGRSRPLADEQPGLNE